MSISRFYVCAVPRAAWQEGTVPGGVSLERLAADALVCERRIAKEVNLEEEHERYTLICRRLEQEIAASARMRQTNTLNDFQAVLRSGYFPAQGYLPGYLALLSYTLKDPGPERLGASFFPPDQVGKHRQAFSGWVDQQGVAKTPIVEQRLSFFEWAEQFGCGVVELQAAFHLADDNWRSAESAIARPALNDEAEGRYIEIPAFVASGLEIEYFSQKGRKQHLAQILEQQIRQALQTAEPVSFGNQAPHDVIAEVLNGFVFVPPGETSRRIDLRVVYADGSEAEPFPLFCLPRAGAGPKNSVSPLRVALMSMRHLELDSEIDFCWFRNREVSRTRTLAETDSFCFDATREQLRDSLALGDLAMHLYHTGFEPAVLGFYRGLVHTLLALKQKPQSPSLSITPYYLRDGKNYQAGTPWL